MPVEFGTVTARHDRVLIVGTGTSLLGFDPDRLRIPGVHVIAVNQAVAHIPCQYWVTVDPGPTNRALMANRRAGVGYCAAVPNDYGQPGARLLAHRRPAEPDVLYLHRVTGNGPFSARHELSEDPGALHTGNSVWGGLGLAYHMRPERIGLLGVDGTQSRYGLGQGRPVSSLSHLPELFSSAVPQLISRDIEVMNGSLRSRITCFPRVTIDRVLEWITE